MMMILIMILMMIPTMIDDTNDDTDDDTDDGGRGNRRPLPGGAVHFSSPPSGPPACGGVRTNFRDLDPVWERERERVNRDALTRLKTPEGSADPEIDFPIKKSIFDPKTHFEKIRFFIKNVICS